MECLCDAVSFHVGHLEGFEYLFNEFVLSER